MRRALVTASLAALAFWWWRSSSGDPPPIRIGTFNIRSFPDAETDLARVAERIAEMDADLFAIQEIGSTQALAEVLADASARTGRQLAYRAATYCETQRFRIAVVYDRARLRVIEERRLNSRRRCTSGQPSAHLVLFESESGERIGMVSTHLKSGGGAEHARRRREQWRGLLATVESLRRELGAPIVVAGDFNSTGWHNDEHGERSFIDELLRPTDLRLATAELACTAYWRPPGDDAYAPSTLDHILLSGAADQVRAIGMCEHLRCQRRAPDEMADDYRRVSDHCPVIAELR